MVLGSWGRGSCCFFSSEKQWDEGNRNAKIIFGKKDHMHGFRRGAGGPDPLGKSQLNGFL